MAEREQAHRHIQDAKLVDANAATERRVPFISGGITLAALIAAAAIGIWGEAANYAMVIAIGGIISPFIGPLIGRILDRGRKEDSPPTPQPDQKPPKPGQ